MAYLCLILIFICLATWAQAEKKCLSPITDEHLNYLDEMIDSQLKTSCSVKIKLMDNKIVGDYCYKRGVISQLYTLLEKLEFKPNSQYYNYTKRLNDLYDQRFQDCIDENDDLTQEDLAPCSRYIDLNPVQLLERIKTSFVIFRDFNSKSESEVTCYEEYRMCEEEYDHSAKGPQCACPSPTTPINSATSTQKSLSNSEIKSSPHASIIPFNTVSITEHTSGTDLQNPQQSSSESIELPSVILTSTPTAVQTLTTFPDHLHAATTDRLVSGPESPLTKMDISFSGMEFTNGITESAYTMSFSQTRKYPENFNMASLNTDGAHAETLSTTNTVLDKDFSQQTGELTSVTEPVVGELVETTELNIVSQSSVSNFQKYSEPSTEPTIESSSSSTVTKVRRSVENLDKTLKVYVSSTHPQLVLTSDDRTSTLLQLTSSIPPTIKFPQTMEQENEIRDLGWAAAYIFPAVVTTKPAISDTTMSSPVSGVQSLPSEASLHPKLMAHEGGYTYNNNQQLEQNVAAFISEDRANRGAGPVHGSNPLPILETEQHHHGRQNSNLFLVMIPSILAILFLCGLLYSVYRYRRLIRQLNREQVQELHEMRPLALAV